MSSIKKELYAFNFSIRGASHIKSEKLCQDASMSSTGVDHTPSKYAIAIVCDGHGSDNCFRSDIGSNIACNEASSAIKNFMKNFLSENKSRHLLKKLNENSDAFMLQLEKNILFNWLKEINAHYKENPFSNEELALMDGKYRKKFDTNPDTQFIKAYGTTLIASVLYPGYFWFGLQVGDGKCVVCDKNDNYIQPIPPDNKCFLNVTTSLCDQDAIRNFRHYYSKDTDLRSIFLGSDGIDDSFVNDADLHDFYQEIMKTFMEKEKKIAKREIEDFLPILSEKGSKDDISISAILKL